jgi:hypothetical protein
MLEAVASGRWSMSTDRQVTTGSQMVNGCSLGRWAAFRPRFTAIIRMFACGPSSRVATTDWQWHVKQYCCQHVHIQVGPFRQGIVYITTFCAYGRKRIDVEQAATCMVRLKAEKMHHTRD